MCVMVCVCVCEVDAVVVVVVVDAEEDAKGAGPAEQRGRRAAEGDAATATSAWSARIECAVLHFMESMDESIRAVYGEFTPTIAFACWKSEYVMCCVRPSLHFVHVRENPGAHGARYFERGWAHAMRRTRTRRARAGDGEKRSGLLLWGGHSV